MIARSVMPISYLLAGPLADNVFGPLMDVNGALANTFFGTLLGTGAGRGIGLMFVISARPAFSSPSWCMPIRASATSKTNCRMPSQSQPISQNQKGDPCVISLFDSTGYLPALSLTVITPVEVNSSDQPVQRWTDQESDHEHDEEELPPTDCQDRPACKHAQPEGRHAQKNLNGFIGSHSTSAF
jgi:hypothetical protein